MARSMFLTADEIAVFRADRPYRGSTDGQSFVVAGPVQYASEALDKATEGYDYDDVFQVIRVDVSAAHSQDVTDDVATALIGTDDFDLWVSAYDTGKQYHPAFMDAAVTESASHLAHNMKAYHADMARCLAREASI